MRMVDIITKKRDGGILTDEEISFFVKGYVDGKIPDYQVSALLMAILFKGMSNEEIVTLTDRMEHSGDVMDLSSINSTILLFFNAYWWSNLAKSGIVAVKNTASLFKYFVI